MHTIKITPKADSTNKQICEMYKILKSDKGYAFITKNKMDQLCPFSLFLSSGEVIIEITPRNTPRKISNELLRKIKQ